MPLDFAQLALQIEQMARAAGGDDFRRKVDLAQRLLRTLDPDAVRAKLKTRAANQRVPWLVAHIPNTLAASAPVPATPADFAVVAADGSFIPPERHSPVRYYVVNTGRVVLRYGTDPGADMSACAALYHEERDLYLVDEDEGVEKTTAVEGAVLGARMAVAEMRALWEAAQAVTHRPLVALSDGTLILWTIQSQSKAVREQFVGEYRATLDRFRAAGIPVASYLSKPNTQDVVNALRSAVCEGNPSHCGSCDCPATARAQSLDLLHVRDLLAFGWLAPGERSDVFESRSQILEDYAEHHIQFFYLNVDGELARVEAPQWVMRDEAMLSLLHAVVMDQCCRSPSYPPYPSVLQEAHETAVIPAGDRRVIERIVEETLGERGIAYVRGAKDGSKRTRAI